MNLNAATTIIEEKTLTDSERAAIWQSLNGQSKIMVKTFKFLSKLVK